MALGTKIERTLHPRRKPLLLCREAHKRIINFRYDNGVTASFVRNPDGNVKTFSFPAAGINDAGIIVGNGPGTSDNAVGLVLIGNKEFSYTFAGSVSTNFYGINNSNVIVGVQTDSSCA